jgi:hypothetical protein
MKLFIFVVVFLNRIFAIYANQVNAYITLPSKYQYKKYDILRSSLELISQSKETCTKIEMKFTCDDLSQNPNPHNVFASVWMNDNSIWDDSIDKMRLTITVTMNELGETISYPGLDLVNQLKLQNPLQLDAADMFLSKELSDTTFVCGSMEFPVHRFLLACT